MTYYKYKARGLDSLINWDTITDKSITALTEAHNERQAKRDDVDKFTSDMTKALGNMPMSSWRTGNEVALAYADQVQEALLSLDKQLKSGKLRYRDYVTKRQNIKDGTELFTNSSKKFGEMYDVHMKRIQEGKASEKEIWMQAQVEEMMNLRNISTVVDPVTFMPNVMQTAEDGTRKIMNIGEMYANMNFQQDVYDLGVGAKAAVDGLGENKTLYINKAKQVGGLNYVFTLSDPTKVAANDETLKGYLDWEKLKVEEIMSDTGRMESILTTNVDGASEYGFTTDYEEFKKNKNLIYIDNSKDARPPEFHPEQEKKIKAAIETYIRSAIDSEANISSMSTNYFTEDGDYMKTTKTENNKMLTIAEAWRDIYAGTAEQKTAAAIAIRELDSNIKDVEFTEDGGLLITYKDDTKVPFPMEGISNIDQWMTTGAKFTGVNDANIIKKALSGKEEWVYNPEKGKTASREFARTTGELMNDHLQNGINASNFTNSSEDAMKKELGSFLSAYGFTYNYRRFNTSTIEAPNGAVLEVESGLSPEEAAKQKEDIIRFVTENAEGKTVKELETKGILSEESVPKGGLDYTKK